MLQIHGMVPNPEMCTLAKQVTGFVGLHSTDHLLREWRRKGDLNSVSPHLAKQWTAMSNFTAPAIFFGGGEGGENFLVQQGEQHRLTSKYRM